jgi:anti-sigma regulatory factor (Ser/Thr protein kinase)
MSIAFMRRHYALRVAFGQGRFRPTSAAPARQFDGLAPAGIRLSSTLAAVMADISLRTDLGELVRLAEFVDRFAATAALPADAALQLNLALEELVTNTISYGYPTGAEGTIQLRLGRVADWIEVELSDDGVAFDPRTLPEPDTAASLDSRPIGGLGVHLVRQFVDQIDYRRDGDRNRLRLRKRLGGRRDRGAERGE